MNEHDFCKELILTDRKPNAEEEQRLKVHLQGCEECRRLYSDLKACLTFIKTAPARQPRPDFSARVAQNIAMRQAKQARQRKIIFIVATVVILIALFTTLVFTLTPENISGLIRGFANCAVFMINAITGFDVAMSAAGSSIGRLQYAFVLGMMADISIILLSAFMIKNAKKGEQQNE